MRWTYHVRARSGELERAEIDAPSRAQAYEQLSAQGIKPLRLEQTSENSSRHISHNPSTVRGLLAGLLVVTLALIGWFFLRSPSQHPISPKERTAQKLVHAQKTKTPAARAPASTQMLHKVVRKSPEKPAVTNCVTLAPPSLPSTPTHAPSTPSSLPPPTFDNPSDQLLAMVASEDGTTLMPPMPISASLEKDFLDSLKRPIKILPTDDEETRTIKQRVIEMRQQMKELVDQGMKVSEVLSKHQKLANENYQIRANAMTELLKLRNSGDEKSALEYRRKMNIALQQMGISAMTLPITEDEKLESRALRSERHRERMAQREAQKAAREAAANPPQK